MNHKNFSQESFESFADLWNRVVAFARRRYPDLDPEELAAIAICRVFTTNSSVGPGAMYSFLCTTVTRLAYSKLRLKPPTVPLQFEPMEQDCCTDFSESQIVALWEEVQRLKPALQIVFEMKLNELSTPEIAQQLGLSPRTVLARYNEALTILRRRLSN